MINRLTAYVVPVDGFRLLNSEIGNDREECYNKWYQQAVVFVSLTRR